MDVLECLPVEAREGLLPIREGARHLPVCERTLRRYVKAGKVAGVYGVTGGKMFIFVPEVLRSLRRRGREFAPASVTDPEAA